jgi:hypothetical protein
VRGDRGVERGRSDADALEQIHEPLICESALRLVRPRRTAP